MLSCGVSSAVEIISGVVNFTFLRAQHSFKYETQKHEHDRKLILNASTAEQHRQTGKISKSTAGMENRFIERMSDTC